MKICTIFIAQSIAVLSRTWPGLGLGRPTYDLEYGYCYSIKGSYKYSQFSLFKLLQLLYSYEALDILLQRVGCEGAWTHAQVRFVVARVSEYVIKHIRVMTL